MSLNLRGGFSEVLRLATENYTPAVSVSLTQPGDSFAVWELEVFADIIGAGVQSLGRLLTLPVPLGGAPSSVVALARVPGAQSYEVRAFCSDSEAVAQVDLAGDDIGSCCGLRALNGAVLVSLAVLPPQELPAAGAFTDWSPPVRRGESDEASVIIEYVAQGVGGVASLQGQWWMGSRWQTATAQLSPALILDEPQTAPPAAAAGNTRVLVATFKAPTGAQAFRTRARESGAPVTPGLILLQARW